MAASAIPVENVYYLLCYAWNCLEERDLTSVDVSATMRLPELFGRVLATGVARVLKRGLDQSYVTSEGEIAGVRGRLDIAGSLKRATFMRSRAWCAYDDLSPDIPHNRIIKTTLRRLAAVEGVDPVLAESLRDLYRRMPEVADTPVTDHSFARIVVGRNNSYYGFLLNVCEIVHRNLLVDEHTGQAIFRDFSRDDKQMAKLFERFLFNFFAKEQCEYAIAAPQLRWAASGADADLAYVPSMQTDIVLSNRAETVVIDAKFYAETLPQRFDKRSVRPSHLYQLHAYMNHAPRPSAGSQVRGMLIYPRTIESVRVSVTLAGHPVIAATINLDQPWDGIHRDLLGLLRSTI